MLQPTARMSTLPHQGTLGLKTLRREAEQKLARLAPLPDDVHDRSVAPLTQALGRGTGKSVMLEREATQLALTGCTKRVERRK